MARRNLTAEEKAAMQEARVRSKVERGEALEAVVNNPQFVNPKFWKTVPADVVLEVEQAIQKNKDLLKKARIAELEQELAALKG